MTVWFPFGWYMLPVLPLLCLLSTVVLARQVEKPEPFILFCFIGLVLVPALSYRLGTDAASMRALVRAAFVLGLLMPLACTIWSTRFLMWGSRFTVWALLIAALILQAVGDINRGF